MRPFLFHTDQVQPRRVPANLSQAARSWREQEPCRGIPMPGLLCQPPVRSLSKHMKPANHRWRTLGVGLQTFKHTLIVAGLLLNFLPVRSSAQVFTMQVESTAAPATPLVNHGDLWRFYKPTNGEPVADWQTMADVS